MMCSRLLRPHVESASRGIGHGFHRAVDWTVERYRGSLEWVIRHETLTLLLTLGTVVATVWLYIIIPKGFLPQQDTGLILAVMEGGQEVSFTEMKRLQGAVEAVIRKDPEVTGVVSVIGVTPLNATPNAGRIAITLRARDVRDTPVTTVIERLQHAVAAIAGVVVYFQPVQDIQISTRLSRAQYQYTSPAPIRRKSPSGARGSPSGCNRLRSCATSPPRRRRTASGSTSRSIARPRAGSASR